MLRALDLAVKVPMPGENEETAPAPRCCCPPDAPLRKIALNSSMGEWKVAVLPAAGESVKELAIALELGEVELVSLTPVNSDRN